MTESQALHPLGVQLHKGTQLPEYPLPSEGKSSLETQVLFCYLPVESGTSLNNIEIANAKTYKNEIKSKSLY